MTTETQIVSPNVGNFIDSLREIGYSTEVAVADLIDNSITANSTEIHIYAVTKPILSFAILDNGKGMSETELVEAMRLAGKNQRDVRDKNDLGRFGLGLKTASFSQCKKLTVFTKNKEHISSRQWDLNYIAEKNEWFLITPKKNHNLPLYDALEKLQSGTLVVWEEIDKIPTANLAEMIDKLRKHLSLVFHKFLEGQIPGKKLNILVNSNPIKAFNPFNINHPATQQITSEKINIYGSSVSIQPFILPHHSKISQQEYELYATEEGYVKSQGFYLYRENRIIIYGTWWGLHKAVDAHKLIRVRIEIPNSMDSHWGIDIKKSMARPADVIKSDLRRIINQVIDKGARPFSARGKKIEDKSIIQFWETYPIKDGFRFAINQNHPLYIDLISNLDDYQKEKLKYFLKGLQAYLPLDAIQSKLQTDPHSLQQESALSEDDICKLLIKLKESGLSDEYKQELLKTEIFKNRPEIFNS
ncbi:ATP-binding protein [Flavobacterium macrobrachii]|uniref:ATP-binding protein n=1 Tax=Flavobacterium macrobrachii TaxID=591204 RepID=A0ABS2CTY2_9FLAO|nr:ATP-binding protein [Flavobacterium macrobrachii]MBM6498354.1 ATP-binding protein [Flavobacterium macrobrachii]